MKHKNCLGFSIVFIIVIICIAIAVPLSDTQNSQNNQSDSTVEYSIGNTIICKDYQITINGYSIKNSYDSNTINNGEEAIAIFVTIKNNSNDEITFYENRLNLINNNGEIIAPSSLTWQIWDGIRLNNIKLSSNGEKTGYIVFNNTNTDNSKLSLNFKCSSSIFDNSKYIINLTK